MTAAMQVVSSSVWMTCIRGLCGLFVDRSTSSDDGPAQIRRSQRFSYRCRGDGQSYVFSPGGHTLRIIYHLYLLNKAWRGRQIRRQNVATITHLGKFIFFPVSNGSSQNWLKTLSTFRQWGVISWIRLTTWIANGAVIIARVSSWRMQTQPRLRWLKAALNNLESGRDMCGCINEK